MSDFDTRRIGEVAALQEQVNSLKMQAAGYKMIAERWQPRFTVAIDNQMAKVSLIFGGKIATATFPIADLAQADETTATTSILESMCENLIIDQLRPILRPEVHNLIENAKTMSGAGKW